MKKLTPKPIMSEQQDLSILEVILDKFNYKRALMRIETIYDVVQNQKVAAIVEVGRRG